MRFDIEPGVGALLIRFGMTKSQVHSLLGQPEGSSQIWDKSGTQDFWLQSNVVVGYDTEDFVKHLGFGPGDFELSIRGTRLWSPAEHPDPNVVLLGFDSKPVERLGFLVFDQICVTTTGYHDDDDSQRAITAYPPGKWDKHLTKARAPDLSRYMHS